MHQQEIELVWEKLFANVSAVIDIKSVLDKKNNFELYLLLLSKAIFN